jgi:GNAT superfamily N-acetyltransferase
MLGHRQTDDAMTHAATGDEIAQIERIERDAWLDMFAAAPEAQSVQSRHAEACALIGDQRLPIFVLNRCIGLGAGRDLTQADLDQAIRWLDAQANPTWCIQLPPMSSAGRIEGWLRQRGLQPSGTGWAKFLRRTGAADSGTADSGAASTTFAIREVTPAERADFGVVMIGGYGFPDAMQPWFEAFVGRRGWRIYVAYQGVMPVACGTLYLDHGWGWLGCDATLPGHRGQGAQAALIQRRVADAFAAGADAVSAETDQPAPDREQGSHSYLNYLRAGFTRAYIRPNYSRTSAAG